MDTGLRLGDMDGSAIAGGGNETVSRGIINNTLKSNLLGTEWQWLLEQMERIGADPQQRIVAQVFTSLPRQLKAAGKERISLGEQQTGPNELPLMVKDWPIVRLARVWILMAIPPQERPTYVQLIERLFAYGEMEELAALYAALPIFHYPEAWLSRCKEGIRSNIGLVRQAVMLHNPYPSRFLDEGSWNQLVLKAFFTKEPVMEIVGLRERNNPRLAEALVDYAYERHAAKRTIDPMLWILVAPFLDERAYNLMARILGERQTLLERQAISHAFKHSDFGPARAHVEGNTELIPLSDAVGTPWQNWMAGQQKIR